MKFFAAIMLVAVSAIQVREGDMDAAAQVKAFGEKLGIEIPEEVA